jgi:hypothetical protein
MGATGATGPSGADGETTSCGEVPYDNGTHVRGQRRRLSYLGASYIAIGCDDRQPSDRHGLLGL